MDLSVRVNLPTILGAAALLLQACATATPPPVETAANAPKGPTVGEEVGAVVRNKIEVGFPTGRASLTPDANAKLDLAVRLFRDANPVLMFTTGYSDRTGDEYNNLLLSARRAQVVKRALVDRGIPADRLLLQALGSSEQGNASQPNSAEDRRVVITWRLF